MQILKKIKSGSKEYQLLCCNCNQIKKIENKEDTFKKYIWSGVEQLAARQAHNLEVAGSNPAPATYFSQAHNMEVAPHGRGPRNFK